MYNQLRYSIPVPISEPQNRQKGQTQDASLSRTASPMHNQLSYSSPNQWAPKQTERSNSRCFIQQDSKPNAQSAQLFQSQSVSPKTEKVTISPQREVPHHTSWPKQHATWTTQQCMANNPAIHSIFTQSFPLQHQHQPLALPQSDLGEPDSQTRSHNQEKPHHISIKFTFMTVTLNIH